MSSFFILDFIHVEGITESGLAFEMSESVMKHCEQFINITSSSSCLNAEYYETITIYYWLLLSMQHLSNLQHHGHQ